MVWRDLLGPAVLLLVILGLLAALPALAMLFR
jgi:hypothetical protein